MDGGETYGGGSANFCSTERTFQKGTQKPSKHHSKRMRERAQKRKVDASGDQNRSKSLFRAEVP